jgi:hypothetical protein
VSTSSGPSITVSPSQDLQAAINGAAPGTTVHVAAGTYAGGLDITASNVTIQADGKVNIVGGSTTSDGDMVTIRGDNTQFVGFDVSGAQSPGAYTLITVLGQGDSIINDTVHDLQTGGLNSWGGAIVAGDGSNASSGANVTISGNTVANVGPPGQTSNLVHGIYAASPGATITGNSISNIDGTAITSWHAASNMTVTGNTIDTAYQGITLGASDGAINQGSTVTGNTITHSPNPIDQEGSFANNTIAENAVQ